MILKPQDLLVAFKLLSWGAQRWTYARLSQELGISTSEAHASIKRGLASGLLQRPEVSQGPPRRGVKGEGNAAKASVIERKVGRSKKELPAEGAADNPARVSVKALAEFVVHGAKYVFVAELVPASTGVPTALADPLFAGSAADETYVWPHAQGTARGTGIKPLHANVPFAAMQDARLYELLANFDLLRVGRPKDRAAAAKRFQTWLAATSAEPEVPTAPSAPVEPPAEPALLVSQDDSVAAQNPMTVVAQAEAGRPNRRRRAKATAEDQFSFTFES